MTQCIGCLQASLLLLLQVCGCSDVTKTSVVLQALQDTLTQGQQALETMQLSLSQLQRQTLSVAEPKAMERLWKLVCIYAGA